ncbi:hypothetical protein HW132_35370, partial [Brasilonema sp. CT11]|nr:hypothetical protein [Brasilonema sp. CT11]
MALDPLEFQKIVKMVANHASFDPNMVIDLFSDAVEPQEQNNSAEKFKVFDFLFERIERSILQVDRFTVDSSLDGWTDVKQDLREKMSFVNGLVKNELPKMFQVQIPRRYHQTINYLMHLHL